MKILVTGGAGFIGSNFIRFELKQNPSFKIVNLDKLTYAGNLDNLKNIKGNPNYKFIKGDIADSDKVSQVIKEEKPDVIVNFAAESHVDNSIDSPNLFIRTNILGVGVLLDIARKNDIKRFLQISTDEVYGSIKKGEFKEEDSLKPNSPYSASKASADLLVRSFIKTYNFPALIVRSSNNFGPYQYKEKLIPLFISNLLQDKKVPLYGKGDNVREWIYVIDNCRAIDKVMREGEVGQIYNIGSGIRKSNLEITELLLKELGKDKSYIRYVEDRKGHDFRYALDSSKIRSLGWKPKYKFKEALKETINWYSKNKWWWKNN